MHQTLRRALTHALVAPVAFVAVVGGSVGAVAVLTDPVTTSTPTDRQLTPAEQLIGRHGCWTGRAPADMTGRIPGHVVVTTPAGRTIYSTAQVGPALEQVFDGTEHGLVVHAFCR